MTGFSHERDQFYEQLFASLDRSASPPDPLVRPVNVCMQPAIKSPPWLEHTLLVRNRGPSERRTSECASLYAAAGTNGPTKRGEQEEG